MSRYEIIDGHIKVIYGNNNVFRCLFLFVSDTRLVRDESNSSKVNEALLQFDNYCNSRDGRYICMFTSDTIPGIQVDRITMAEFFRRYGVPESHIKQLIRADRYRHLIEAGNASNILGSWQPWDTWFNRVESITLKRSGWRSYSLPPSSDLASCMSLLRFHSNSNLYSRLIF